MNKTTIEWTDYTWNPVTGCHKVSTGCKNCYAETLTNRFAKTWGVKSFREVVPHHDRLSEPTRYQKKWAGKKVFVCSMSDLFQEEVPFDFIAQVFIEMRWTLGTTYQVLTKRPKRVLEFMKWFADAMGMPYIFPANCWIGTSCENQQTADERIPYLLEIPATVRFLSCEPLLGPIDLLHVNSREDEHSRTYIDALSFVKETCPRINWVIAGGESGHNARPIHPEWVRSLRDQCAAANVPFFFKQWGEYVVADQMPKTLYQALRRGETKHKIGAMVMDDGLTYHFHKTGKSKSGNLLDGKQHLEFPNV